MEPRRIHLCCAGARASAGPPHPPTDRVFFSEKEYASSPYIVRLNFDSISFVHRGTHVVERRFVFPSRVLHAVLADFAPRALHNTDHNGINESRQTEATARRPLQPARRPHLCVLVRSDCLNVYSAAGEVFEVALPFQANKLLPIKGRGLLLQRSQAVQLPVTPSKRPRDAAAVALARKNRRASTSNRGDGDRYNYSSETGETRPRYFTLRHPLDEVKPVALSGRGDKFLSDSALEAVSVLEEGELPLLVSFHRWEQRFCVYRLSGVEKGPGKWSRPKVRVVDGPAWTRYRARTDLDELRVRIEPEWIATQLWKSPRVGSVKSKPVFLSPIISPPPAVAASPVAPSPIATTSSSSSSGSDTKVAFIASGVNGFPLLCLMDRDAGTLVLKPISQQGDAASIRDEGDSAAAGVRILHCRDAVPIRQQRYARALDYGANDGKDQHDDGSVDIVVLEKDGTLMLYRAHRQICRLELPSLEKDDPESSVDASESGRPRLMGDVRLNSTEQGYAYEIVFPEICGPWSGRIWRFEHPLKVVNSPLLQQVFDVLDCVVPPKASCAFKADVIYRAQQCAGSTAEEESRTGDDLEWRSFRDCMIALLATQKDSSQPSVGAGTADGERMTAPRSSFEALCQSEFHDLYQYEHAMLFATMELPGFEASARKPGANRALNMESLQNDSDHACPGMEEHVEIIFAGLHLLCEEFKLSTTLFRHRLLLADFLLEMALRLGLESFVEYYKQDNCVLQHQPSTQVASSELRRQSKTQAGELLSFREYGCVPDLIIWLHSQMMAKSHSLADFPVLFEGSQQELSSNNSFRHPGNPLRRTRAICRVYELIFGRSQETPQSNAFQLISYLAQDPIGSALSLDDLPVGLSFPVVQTIRQVKHHPPSFITEDICAFVGREDLSIASADNLGEQFDYYSDVQRHDPEEPDLHAEEETHGDSDGLEEITSRSQPLFPGDQRMKEVARLLRSSRPLCLKLEKTPDLSDLDYAQQQQARLLLLCKRSMALSVARGMVTLGSFDVSTAQTQIWRLHIPALPLAGRKPPANAIVELDLSGFAKELTYWPQFHNGCATGLRLPAHDLSGVINRHWIKYHRPSVNDVQQPNTAAGRQTPAAQSSDAAGRNLEESYAAHAGLLLGIGLRGHLKCLSMADVYNYLSLSNEFVTVAIMLGMASTAAHCRRKRQEQAATTKPFSSDEASSSEPSSELPPLEPDHLFSGFPELSSSDKTPLLGTGLELALERSVSKMLCLHVPSLLPPPFGGFSVPASTQTAALLGLGILYQGTGYRLMTELLLAEIARSPSSAQFVGSSNAGLSTTSFDQLEGYALAAGMALGLVVLGRGQTTCGDPGLADLKLEEKLHRYIVGGAQQYRDTNAAGSCLYRGRRWQAFGSGGNGFNSSVNGSNSGNGAPDGTTGASPGADRGSKQAGDRTGARGGGEHVNTGVTACASSLVLAFMYMQTDNKAVAAQLVVPDTLILLDYVRPDILLVRTLAKNLVMWSDISPKVEWIEQHEVPAQLLQAYKSIQSSGKDEKIPDGSPSHSDLHSICEAYANIVAGACMSLGLRFAGTANMSARATLRKYVLHFRELRTKASSSSSSMLLRGTSNVVAAATERATVERCLAVCAQALALVDAGTGNVETLALLRSVTLRQRVDAAMSYGNHMALTMAIGLLFLGGGRATVSRSKEAIAALVISLYPMPPLNTADNKYHLQAFRHLYVLAVDTSRLLETVDVNTKTTSAVTVRVELRPANDDSQSAHQLLRSPCLLPDLSTIHRLVISDREFYPIEIMMASSSRKLGNGSVRTANAMRLELLRSKNVVFLKRRQRKDLKGLADFTDERGHLHGVPRGGESSSDDQLRILFRSYFSSGDVGDEDECDDGDDESGRLVVADWGSSWWASQLSPRALEYVNEEAQLLLPPYLNVLHALFRLQQMPQLSCVTEVVALSLFSEYCRLLEGNSLPGADGENLDAVNKAEILEKEPSLPDFGVGLATQTEEALGALWHRTPLSITSMASARVQLLVGATPASTKAPSVADDFFVSVLVRYFAGPSTASLPVAEQPRAADKDWKAKFQRVLAACSQAQPQTTSTTSAPPRFQLSAFLEQDELTEAEKTFWLKLVSFFLFSTS
jgi:hypothetical protein